MSRVLPRAHLHSSALLRFLTEKAQLPPPHAPGEVGVRLGDWLDFRQAIALQSFIGSLDANDAPAALPTARVDGPVLRERFGQVRLALEASIVQGSVPAPGMPRIEHPATELPQPIDAKTAFDPFRRYASGHQRQMDQVIRGLRTQLRGMLDKGTTAQRQLSTLDALFDNVLLAREARLLGQWPNAFEKRFVQGLRAHLKALVQAEQADEPAPRTSPWLAPLFEDLRQALLLELDLRVQPLLGLIEALAPNPTAQA
jgi:hypothetical protein